MILKANVLGKLSVTSETHRAIYGTHRRIDGTTTNGGRARVSVQKWLFKGHERTLDGGHGRGACVEYTDGVGPII